MIENYARDAGAKGICIGLKHVTNIKILGLNRIFNKYT